MFEIESRLIDFDLSLIRVCLMSCRAGLACCPSRSLPCSDQRWNKCRNGAGWWFTSFQERESRSRVFLSCTLTSSFSYTFIQLWNVSSSPRDASLLIPCNLATRFVRFSLRIPFIFLSLLSLSPFYL